MRIDEINNRLAEIRGMIAAPDFDQSQSAALLEEVRSLNAERQQIADQAAQAEELRRQVGAGTIAQIQRQEQEARGGSHPAEAEEPAASAVYRRAWLKNLAVRSGVHIFGDMTEEERAAYLALMERHTAYLREEIQHVPAH